MIASNGQETSPARYLIQNGSVLTNCEVCREHHRLTICLPSFPHAKAGQFLHLCPASSTSANYATCDDPWSARHDDWFADLSAPLLRRAFSIARLAETKHGIEADVIYRVVGTGTRWMQKLRPGDAVSVLGPLGNSFPISPTKPTAWLVAGGVGLPPMLWLAKTLNEANKRTIAFCGAQSADLLALTPDPAHPPAGDAGKATRSAVEFAEVNAETIISTDDGSLGFRGHVGAALTAYANANSAPPGDVIVYTCGPERMMRFVAEFCSQRNIECYVCVERNMACGTGMCQSCVVPVRDAADPAGWRYRLCCMEGPVFDSREIQWETPR